MRGHGHSSRAARWAHLVLGLLLAAGFAPQHEALAEAPARPSTPRSVQAAEEAARTAKARRSHAQEGQSRPRRASKKPPRSKKKSRSRKKSRSKGRRSHSRGARHLDTSWHRPATAEECEALASAPTGSWGLMSLAAKRCIAVRPIGDAGLDAAEQAHVREAFVDKREGELHDIDTRLLRVLQRAVRHFDVPYIHLISGYRPGRSASRHAHGLAADVVFPGVTNRELARFMRQQGFMGVGIYMRTGFVHVDVRERSYFWLDWSPPGKKWRGKPILMGEAREADRAALERGETPFEAPEDLTEAVQARRARQARARAARAARKREAKRRAAQAKRRAAARRAHASHAATQAHTRSAEPVAEAPSGGRR